MLFDSPAITSPLAARMRPRTLDEFVGQERCCRAGPRAARRDRTRCGAVDDSLGTAGQRKDDAGRDRRRAYRRVLRTHVGGQRRRRRSAPRRQRGEDSAARREARPFSSSTRSIVSTRRSRTRCCPFVEDGTVTLIGATTENPSFEVNSALLSRARVFVLEALSDEEVGEIVDARLRDAERGLGAKALTLDDDARAVLIGLANGDARAALNALELAAASTPGETRAGSTLASCARRCSGASDGTTRPATCTTTRSARSSNRCARAMRTRRSTGSRG